MADLTPMAKQYREIKSRHNDAILFYRLGDFYEMFNDDALVASRELEITLTGRGDGDSRMPMCGVPFHAADSYINKLISRGFKVAVCEQVEDPSQKGSKGVVKREVVKIITPGTVVEPKMLNEKRSNWLASVSFEKGSLGFAMVDASTGDFRVTLLEGGDSLEKLQDEIERINPSECLIPDIVPDSHKELIDYLKINAIATSQYNDVYDSEVASQKLKEHFGVSSLDSFGIAEEAAVLGASAAIIDYLNNTQKTRLGHINRISRYHVDGFMYLDRPTLRNLEITETIRDKTLRGSLLWVMDRTKTGMGGRMLRNWLLEPLLDVKAINDRLDAVEEISSSAGLRMGLEEELKSLSDVERLAGKIAVKTANARDLIALKDSLEKLPSLKKKLEGTRSKMIKGISSLPDLGVIVDKINTSIVADPPPQISGGGIIRDGYNSELDELKSVSRGGKEWLAQLESKERSRTGIKSLKVGFTKVFGYYIDVTKSNLSQVPPDYIRKQTLVNNERFITPELKERETMILNAEERITELEYSIFCEVRDFVNGYVGELQKVARSLAELDVLLSFSLIAVSNRYCRPNMLKDTKGISIKEGRHPVVESTIKQRSFVPNNAEIDNEKRRFLLITGPNMAGKSTYMRQIALAVLMAQVGSFIPASSASMSVVDRIFTRIGAMDDIFSGQSTFMMEMTETANILNNATDRSLIILDEIGRGTSTFDGMSIAAAVAEHIHKNIGAKTLFATHYHEITQLADKHAGMMNLNVAVAEEGDHVTFLHRIVEGTADRSYGIQVAKLAGLPKSVIERAKEVYSTLEMVENNLGNKGDRADKGGKSGKAGRQGKGKKSSGRQQIGLF